MHKLERELLLMMESGQKPVTAGITASGVAAVQFKGGGELLLPDVEWGPYLETEGEIAAAALFARLVAVAGLASTREALDAVKNIPPDWVGGVFPNPWRGSGASPIRRAREN